MYLNHFQSDSDSSTASGRRSALTAGSHGLHVFPLVGACDVHRIHRRWKRVGVFSGLYESPPSPYQQLLCGGSCCDGSTSRPARASTQCHVRAARRSLAIRGHRLQHLSLCRCDIMHRFHLHVARHQRRSLLGYFCATQLHHEAHTSTSCSSDSGYLDRFTYNGLRSHPHGLEHNRFPSAEQRLENGG